MLERFNFNYDPTRQGYDTNTWRTLLGDPAIGSTGRLVVDTGAGTAGAIIHYTDFVKGTVNFNVNIPSSPATGDSRYFGLATPSNDGYIRFAIGSELKCETANGGNTTTSDELEWDATGWNGEDLDFQIVWEAGLVRFYIEGTIVYTVTDESIPHGPLSLYVFDNSEDPMTLGDLSVRGTQSVYVNPVTSDSSATIVTGTLSLREVATITEDVEIFLPSLSGEAASDNTSVSENIEIFLPSLSGEAASDNTSVSENIALTVISP